MAELKKKKLSECDMLLTEVQARAKLLFCPINSVVSSS